MSKTTIECYICENCGEVSLDKHDFSKCIVCERDVCKNNSSCSYKINVEIDHRIPNGIPFLNTKTIYVICNKCLDLNKPIPHQLRTILIPLKHGKLYRAGGEYEEKWVFVSEGE